MADGSDVMREALERIAKRTEHAMGSAAAEVHDIAVAALAAPASGEDVGCDRRCALPGKGKECDCRSKTYGLPFASDDWCNCRCHRPPLPDAGRAEGAPSGAEETVLIGMVRSVARGQQPALRVDQTRARSLLAAYDALERNATGLALAGLKTGAELDASQAEVRRLREALRSEMWDALESGSRVGGLELTCPEARDGEAGWWTLAGEWVSKSRLLPLLIAKALGDAAPAPTGAPPPAEPIDSRKASRNHRLAALLKALRDDETVPWFWRNEAKELSEGSLFADLGGLPWQKTAGAPPAGEPLSAVDLPSAPCVFHVGCECRWRGACGSVVRWEGETKRCDGCGKVVGLRTEARPPTEGVPPRCEHVSGPGWRCQLEPGHPEPHMDIPEWQARSFRRINGEMWPASPPVSGEAPRLCARCAHRNGEHCGPDGLGQCDADAGLGTGELCSCAAFVEEL